MQRRALCRKRPPNLAVRKGNYYSRMFSKFSDEPSYEELA